MGTPTKASDRQGGFSIPPIAVASMDDDPPVLARHPRSVAPARRRCYAQDHIGPARFERTRAGAPGARERHRGVPQNALGRRAGDGETPDDERDAAKGARAGAARVHRGGPGGRHPRRGARGHAGGHPVSTARDGGSAREGDGRVRGAQAGARGGHRRAAVQRRGAQGAGRGARAAGGGARRSDVTSRRRRDARAQGQVRGGAASRRARAQDRLEGDQGGRRRDRRLRRQFAERPGGEAARAREIRVAARAPPAGQRGRQPAGHRARRRRRARDRDRGRGTARSGGQRGAQGSDPDARG